VLPNAIVRVSRKRGVSWWTRLGHVLFVGGPAVGSTLALSEKGYGITR
jgi:hypothetical protein